MVVAAERDRSFRPDAALNPLARIRLGGRPCSTSSCPRDWATMLSDTVRFVPRVERDALLCGAAGAGDSLSFPTACREGVAGGIPPVRADAGVIASSTVCS